MSETPITHLAIMREPYLSKVLSGEKTIETRFSKKQIAPYFDMKKLCLTLKNGKKKYLKIGDIIYFKKSGGLIVGKATVESVNFYDILNGKVSYDTIIMDCRKYACLTDDWIQSKKESRYATIIHLKNVEKLKSPILIKKNNQLSWIVDFKIFQV